MSRVDDAIRSHVYPGACSTNVNGQSTVYRDGKQCAFDCWESRVFMPPDPDGSTLPGEPASRFAPVSKTVSVLNLEALGYLPPPLVNDVRLLARSSWAAKWDYFNFDAGRYAFCAVNVSDFLDINKMAANSPRTSSSASYAKSAGEKPPPSRFSYASLFPGGGEKYSDPDNSGMNLFDERVHTNPGKGGDQNWTAAPLVSLMDYNLSLGEDQQGSFYSPFGELIYGHNTGVNFYRDQTGANDQYVKGAARQPFVTSSWFPDNALMKGGDTLGAPLDITKTPPIPQTLLQDKQANMDKVLVDGNTGTSKTFWDMMTEKSHALCALDRFSLYDYLDENDVPLSLALPCVERVPMIAAISPQGNLSVEFVSPTTPRVENPSTTQRLKYYDTKIKIVLGGTSLKSSFIFPFSDGRDAKRYSAQAFARIVFVGSTGAQEDEDKLRKMRNNGFAKNFRPLSDDEWERSVGNDDELFKLTEGPKGRGMLSHTPAENCLLVTLPSAGRKTLSPDKDVRNVERCWMHDENLDLQDVGPTLENTDSDKKTLFRKIEYYKVTPKTEENPVEKEELEKTVYQIVLRPFGADGEVLDIPTGELEEDVFKELCGKYTIRPYFVAWARVTQDGDEGKTVDMVPATYEDDLAFNDIDNQEPMLNLPAANYALGNTPSDFSGSHAMPIMRFPGTLSFTYENALQGQAPGANEWRYKSCYAVDPRFNWAPENWWFEESDSNPTAQNWYDAVFRDGGILDELVQAEFGGEVEGRGDRANDPYLFVSNLGYLQSVGELAFLPHLSSMRENGTPMSVLGDTREYLYDQNNEPAGNLYDGEPRAMSKNSPDRQVLARMPCALAAWKSYQNYRTNPKDETFEFGANLYRRGLVNGSQGFYVNPYTQSDEVMVAALANPPLNYWEAGKNYDWQTKKLKNEDLKFDDVPVFGESSIPQFKGQDVTKVAQFLRRRFEDLSNMIEFPQNTDMSVSDLYVYQRVWEDMFDALDWSGLLDRTVEEVYKDLKAYYESDGSDGQNYRAIYMQNGGNDYEFLNQYARGNGRRSFVPHFSLNLDKVVHKEDLNSNADPLRGQYQKGNDTTCWNNLRDVDRIFLHSYWRDCFANKQQLFLIFVRAESTALGGSGEGTPAQQGGRAVALVWRDPLPTFQSDANGQQSQSSDLPSFAQDHRENDSQIYFQDRRPHKMRILFYRQFD